MDEKYDPLDHQDSEIRPHRWQLGNVILSLLGVFWVCFFAYILYDAATMSRLLANNSPSIQVQEALPDCNAPCPDCTPQPILCPEDWCGKIFYSKTQKGWVICRDPNTGEKHDVLIIKKTSASGTVSTASHENCLTYAYDRCGKTFHSKLSGSCESRFGKPPVYCSQRRHGYVECRDPKTGAVELRIDGNVTETLL